MSLLFKRIVKLVVARGVPDQFFTVSQNAVEITELRIRFSIEKTLRSEPNKSTVVVSNLRAETRAAVEHKPIYVRLEAGYDGQLARIFAGDLRYAMSSKQGTDWETKLEVADGDRAYRHARVGRSFAAGASGADVGQDIADAMGLSITAEALATLRALRFSRGHVIHGPAHKELTRLIELIPGGVVDQLAGPGTFFGDVAAQSAASRRAAARAGTAASHGYSWSIQDGTLQVLAETDVSSNQAALISQDTGMMGSPSLGAPTKDGKPPLMTVKVRLYPSIRPGDLVQIDSLNVRGTYKAERVQHEGDTHGEDWTTTIEARAR